uniref:Uncharacterized protein n=1 Tax=Fagus sylvatica TaxID=28930 RepID=A0A2N9EQZ3_FAGSY
MAGETSGPGPSEQEIRMVALERKFDELLSFVQLIAKRNPDDENQRKEDDRDANNEEPEGHSNTNTTPPPPTPPKPEGKDSQLDSKIDSLEEKIRLMQGLNSFGNTDFSSMSWFPNMTMPPKFKAPEFEKYNGRGDPMIHLQMYCRKMAPYADNEPLLIQTFQDTLTGHAAEWYSQLKKISHWKELADTFLAQYGFNSQIAPDRFDLQRMEKKSNETFREYAQRWREKGGSSTPATRRKRDDQDLLGERIEDALKTKKIVDMTALMALAEQAAKKAPTKKKEGDVQMIGRSNGRPRQVLPTFTMQPIQPRPTPTPAPTQVPAPAPAPQIPARPVGNQFNDNRLPRKEPRQFTPLPMPLTGVFEGLPNITTNPLPNHPEGGVNMVEIEEGGEERISWRRLFYTLEKQRHITPLEAPPGPSTGDACEYHSGARGHSLECCEEFKKEDEMDLDNLQDEGDDWGYFMEDDTDEWRNVDFTKLFQFPCLIVPPGFETREFEIFYENGDPEAHLQKVRREDGLTLGERAFDDLGISREPVKTSSRLVLSAEEPYWLGGFGKSLFGTKKKRKPSHCHQPKTQTTPPLPKKEKSQSRRHHQATSPPPPAEEEYAGPMVEGLSIHTIAEEEDSTTPPTRHCQQGEEAKMWTCVPLLQRVSSSNEITRKTSNDPHVSEIDNKTNCSLDNIDNSDEEIELPNDILEALERQDEGSKPNIEELEIINLADEGEEPREVKIGTRCTTEQKGGAHRTVKRVPRDLRLGTIRSKWPKKTNPRLLSSHTWGTFVYDVMPFGLKNAGATYQRAMVTLFHDMIHHEIEVYVDDMIAKSRTAQDHLTDLRKLFQRLKKYQLRLNPNKCAFGVTSGKLLGFIVSGRGIEIDPAKVQAIRSMPAPKTEKEIRSFLGRINYIARFIAQLTATCEPLFKLLRKRFQEASMGCMLGQQDETGKKEQAIYYLSKKFTEPETRYLLVEKTCCALAWASKKLRQYMLYYTTWLVSRMDPIKYIFEKPALTGKIARWQTYPSEQLELMDSEFPDEDVMTVDEDNHGRWKLYFDGAANSVGSGIGAVLVSPKGQQTPIAVKLGFDCTNNMTEYEACIVVSQTNGEWQARDPKLIPYQRYISRLVPKFKYITFTYTPRAHNHFADALATLASLIKLVEGDDVRPLRIETRDIPAYCVCRGSQSIDSRDARGIDGSPCQRTLPGPEDYESWLLLVDNGEGLHQTCPDVPQMPDVSELQECTSPISPHYGLAMALLSLGNGCDWCELPQRRLTGMSSYWWPSTILPSGWRHVPSRIYASSSRSSIHNSAPYRPKMNGAVEAANKNVKKILSKMTETYKDWHEHLPYALCAYRTSVRTSVGATPYSLVYGMEAVLPVEVEIPSLRILSQTQLEEAEWAPSTLYQRRIERAYNKKARPRTFQPGDLVLKKRNMALSDPRGKFAPSYEGPYVVKKAFSGGAIILADMDGEEFRSPINSDSVIKYHV